jgi:hypothetical protein
MKIEGAKRAAILTDFDHTLTRARMPDGTAGDSVFKTLRLYTRTPDHIKDYTTKLFQKYHPIEQDINITDQEKNQHLDDW